MTPEPPSYEPKPLTAPQAIGRLGLMADEDTRVRTTTSNNSGGNQLRIPGDNTAPLGAFPDGPEGDTPYGKIGAILVHNGDNWEAMYAPDGAGPFVLMHPGRGSMPYWEQTEEC